MAVGMLVRIRDTITRISPTAARAATARRGAAVAALVRYLLRCAARQRTVYLQRDTRSSSNCYNLVANTITRKRLAAKQRRSVLLQIIRPQSRASGKEASRSTTTFTMPMRTRLSVVFIRGHFYAAFVLRQWETVRSVGTRKGIVRLRAIISLPRN